MLIIGLLLAMPTAVILASAASALLAGRLHRGLRQARNRRLRQADMTRAGMDRPLAASARRS